MPEERIVSECRITLAVPSRENPRTSHFFGVVETFETYVGLYKKETLLQAQKRADEHTLKAADAAMDKLIKKCCP